MKVYRYMSEIPGSKCYCAEYKDEFCFGYSHVNAIRNLLQQLRIVKCRTCNISFIKQDSEYNTQCRKCYLTETN